MLRTRDRFVSLFIVAVVTLALTSGGPAYAERIPGGPLAALHDQTEKIVSILRTADADQVRVASVDRELGTLFDLPEMARLALVEQSPAMTASEYRDSVALLTAVFSGIVHRFAAVIAFTHGSGAGLELVGESLDGNRGTVHGYLFIKRPVPITARLHRRGDRWRVYDLTVDGIGMVASYRAQVAAITSRAAFSGLARHLEAKRDALVSEPLFPPPVRSLATSLTDGTTYSAP